MQTKWKFHITSCKYLGYMLYSWRPHHGTLQSPDNPRLAWNPEKSKMFNLSSVFELLPTIHFWIFRTTVPLTCLTHKGTTWHFSNECHSASEALKKAFTTAPSPYPLDPRHLKSLSKPNTSDYTLAAVLSITNQNAKLHLIAFHSWTFSALELNYYVHWQRSYSQFLKLSNVGDIISKALGTPIDVVTDHRNLQYFSTTKILTHRQTHNGPNTFPFFNLIIRFHPGKLSTKPTHSLDDGTSILKRGIVTMPVWIHRITTQYSLPSNWHCPPS